MRWKCPNCGRRGDEATDARQGWERGDRDQPGYVIDACKVCAPTTDDLDRLRDAEADRRMDEERA